MPARRTSIYALLLTKNSEKKLLIHCGYLRCPHVPIGEVVNADERRMTETEADTLHESTTPCWVGAREPID